MPPPPPSPLGFIGLTEHLRSILSLYGYFYNLHEPLLNNIFLYICVNHFDLIMDVVRSKSRQ